jgi:hypothetical protein
VLRVAPKARPVPGTTLALAQAVVTLQAVELDCRVACGDSR